MPTPGYRKDEGSRGMTHVNKRLNMKGASWVEPQGAVVLFEDFLVDVLADTPLVTVTQSGTAVTAAAITGTGGGTVSAGHGGWVGGATDDVDAEIDEVAFGGLGTGAGTPWLAPAQAGNGMAVVEFGFVIPTALTARQYFAGFSDDPVEATGTNGPLNIQSAYTIVDVASDAAGFIFSSLATAPTIWKYGATKANAQSTASAATEGVTGVVDAYTVCRVEIDSSGNAYFYQSTSGSTAIGRQDPVGIGALASAVTAATLLLPVFTCAATATTSAEWEIDYCFAACAR